VRVISEVVAATSRINVWWDVARQVHHAARYAVDLKTEVVEYALL
jgi:hypothetical protein